MELHHKDVITIVDRVFRWESTNTKVTKTVGAKTPTKQRRKSVDNMQAKKPTHESVLNVLATPMKPVPQKKTTALKPHNTAADVTKSTTSKTPRKHQPSSATPSKTQQRQPVNSEVPSTPQAVPPLSVMTSTDAISDNVTPTPMELDPTTEPALQPVALVHTEEMPAPVSTPRKSMCIEEVTKTKTPRKSFAPEIEATKTPQKAIESTVTPRKSISSSQVSKTPRKSIATEEPVTSKTPRKSMSVEAEAAPQSIAESVTDDTRTPRKSITTIEPDVTKTPRTSVKSNCLTYFQSFQRLLANQ